MSRTARTAALAAAAVLACIAAAAAAAVGSSAAGPYAPQGGGGQGGVPSKAVDNSIPYVGGGGGHGMIGYGGGGVTVGVIDTGVDVFHPDFADGRGGSRIVKSHNLLGPGPALDRDGHGTGVAGVIAAGGALQGMAPLAEIISYRVSGDGLSVSPDMIVGAVDRAVDDEVDVVNISLGVNRTNERIDSAINRAVAGGTVVVAAAGNDGPAGGSIGSPGRNPNVITVGATYNNVTSGLVATVEAGGWGAYEAVPMVGAPVPKSPVQGAVAFAGYAREGDIERAGPVDGAIVLAERGGGGEGEGEGGDLVYFSDKERNAAGGGAAALVVYNNEQGIFFGELVHENTPDGYEPRIPTVSMSRDDGIRLREALEASGTITAVLSVRESPDFVAEFSSRGPVSPFYTKPDILAPGVFINTTLNGGGYNMTSGTSFAAPHVAGAAALVLEKWPGLPPAGVKSVLVTTADPVSGLQKGRVREGWDGRAAESTAGRLNVTRALAAETVFAPPLAGIDLSPARPLGEAVITAKSLAGGPVGPLAASIDVPDAVDASYEVAPAPGGAATVTVRAWAGGGGGGTGPWQAGEPRVLHGSLSISDGSVEYTVPVIVRAANGTIRASEVPRSGGGGGSSWPLGGGAAGSAVEAVVEAPSGWTYARITVTDARTGEQYVTSSRPGEPGTVSVSGNGTHWVRAVIRSGGAVAEAYGEVDVQAAVQDSGALQGAILLPSMPERQAAIVAAATALVAAAGIAIAARARRAARAAA